SDDVVVMRGGQEVERGATANVLSAPSQQYTQELLTAAPRVDGEGAAPLSMPADVVLRLDEVGIRYPRAPRRAVSDLTLEVRSSARAALLGESGAENSTVATALPGLISIVQGQMRLRDAAGEAPAFAGPAVSRTPNVRSSLQMV